MSGWGSAILKSIYFLIVFGLIVYLAHVASRILGKRVHLGTGRYMRVVDVIQLGNDRMMAIVKVGEDYLLVSSTPREIGVIKTLEDFDEQDEIGQNHTTGFTQYLERYRNSYKSSLDSIRKVKDKFSNRDGLDE